MSLKKYLKLVKNECFIAKNCAKMSTNVDITAFLLFLNGRESIPSKYK